MQPMRMRALARPWCCRFSNIDTDQIIPARFLTTTTKEGLGRQLFSDWRYRADGTPNPEFVLNRPGGPGLRGAGGRPQFRLRLLARARAVGARRLRHSRGHQHRDRGHLPRQRLEERLLPVTVDESTAAWLLEHPGAAVSIDLADAAPHACRPALDRRFPSRRSRAIACCMVSTSSATCAASCPRSSATKRLTRAPECSALIAVIGRRRHRHRGHRRGGARARADRGALRPFLRVRIRAARRSRHRRHGRSRCPRARSRFAGAPMRCCSARSAAPMVRPNAKVRPEQGILQLRKALGLFANLRPVVPHPAVLDASPIKAELLRGVDIMVVRELTGGIYFGEKQRTATEAFDVCRYTVVEIERVVRVAGAARPRPARASSLRSTRPTCSRPRDYGARWSSASCRASFPTCATSTCWWTPRRCICCKRPRDFDVIVTENMFGDILTDEASMLAGSMGLLPSASLGAQSGTRGGDDLRAHPRLRARHRRPRHRQSICRHPERGDAAALCARARSRGAPARGGGLTRRSTRAR